MAKINRSALMPFTNRQMYDIVNAVEDYPGFLPWCASSKVLGQSETEMEASILMKKGALNHSFSTRNTLTVNEVIHMQLIDGPFKSLSGDWLFTPLSEQASKIELHLNFEFSNRIVGMLIGPVFTQIADSLVDAFCQRAHQVYKK
ncbi:MAG: type II toxin-antitoxin system RatA family toxin [Gammaproteobacteria bacterium]|nr:type II toxin-antitoxin system RatA family toxin [Gammaproteobacteria bacterium]